MLGGCGQKGDARLSGTFVSDKEATLAYLRSTGAYTSGQLEKQGKLLGNFKVTYRDDSLVTELDGRVGTEPFRVVERTATSVVIETMLLDKPRRFTITFTEDGYWLTVVEMRRPYKEKFRKVSQPPDGSDAAGDSEGREE